MSSYEKLSSNSLTPFFPNCRPTLTSVRTNGNAASAASESKLYAKALKVTRSDTHKTITCGALGIIFADALDGRGSSATAVEFDTIVRKLGVEVLRRILLSQLHH